MREVLYCDYFVHITSALFTLVIQKHRASIWILHCKGKMGIGIGKKIVGKGCLVRDEAIVEYCKGKRVLHVGCTDYPFFKSSLEKGYLLHDKVSQVTNQVIGIDIASEDVAAMIDNGYDARVIDAQTMSSYDWDELFEIVLLADVIEHISNPGLVINEARKLLSPHGKVIVTAPNAFGIVRYLKSFFQYEQVHHDHIAYYSSGVLETLATHTGLRVEESSWYQFEVRDKRLIVRLSAAFERAITKLFPWQGEGCISVMTRLEINET